MHFPFLRNCNANQSGTLQGKPASKGPNLPAMNSKTGWFTPDVILMSVSLAKNSFSSAVMKSRHRPLAVRVALILAADIGVCFAVWYIYRYLVLRTVWRVRVACDSIHTDDTRQYLDRIAEDLNKTKLKSKRMRREPSNYLCSRRRAG